MPLPWFGWMSDAPFVGAAYAVTYLFFVGYTVGLLLRTRMDT